MYRRLLGIVFLLSGLVYTNFAQTEVPDEILDFHRPEAWAMKYFNAASLPLKSGLLDHVESGKWALDLEIAHVPRLDQRQRTVGFNGFKEEDLNKTHVFARPAIRYGLPEGFNLSINYLPPIEVFGVKPEFAGVALDKRLMFGKRWQAALRAFTQYGRVEGAFTCSSDIFEFDGDFDSNPFGCDENSNDVFRSLTYGMQALLGRSLTDSGDTFAYISASWQDSDLTFEIDAVTGGFRDNRRQVTDGVGYSIGAGVERQWSEKWRAAVSLFYFPLKIRRPEDIDPQNDDLLQLRVQMSYALF